MGVQLGDIVTRRKIELSELSGKAVAIDGYNTLYQFLAIIRGVDGSPLMDRGRRVTSHLSGLLYRSSNLMESGVRLIYVLDGEPPTLKEAEIKRRMGVKEEALRKYEEALKTGRMEEARVYAQATSVVKDYMVDDAKRLLSLMGIPWVQAPSEGEAQAAHMAIRGDVWAAASQDYDSILFGAPRLVRNITITGRRKLPRKNVYVEVEPEFVELNQLLAELNLTREQVVDLGILIGTDYNPGGVRGIGPKTALKLIRSHGKLESIPEFREISVPVEVSKIRSIFLDPEVTSHYRIEWRPPDVEGVVAFLCGERDFSEERIRKALEKIVAGSREVRSKTTLEKWFG